MNTKLSGHYMRSVAVTLFTFLIAAVIEETTAQQVVWEDHFDNPSVPDPKYWSHDLGGGGWGNNELQVYTLQNAAVQSGKLHITANRIGDTFTSARLSTKGKVEVKYGTIEARIKVPNVANGLWPAFWTLGSTFPQVSWPGCGEIDIMEVGQGIAGNLINKRVVSAAHWLHGADVIASWADKRDMTTFLYDDFHVYSLVWTPTRLETYIDNLPIWDMDIGPLDCESCTELHERHFLMLNLAVGGGFTIGNHSSCGVSSSWEGGCPTPSPSDITASFPAVMEVDYVRITANDDTEISISSSGPSAAPTISPTPRQEQFQQDLGGGSSQSNNQAPSAPTGTPPTTPTPKSNDDYYDDNWRDQSGKYAKSSKSRHCKSSKGSKSAKSRVRTRWLEECPEEGTSLRTTSALGASSATSLCVTWWTILAVFWGAVSTWY